MCDIVCADHLTIACSTVVAGTLEQVILSPKMNCHVKCKLLADLKTQRLGTSKFITVNLQLL